MRACVSALVAAGLDGGDHALPLGRPAQLVDNFKLRAPNPRVPMSLLRASNTLVGQALDALRQACFLRVQKSGPDARK
eukprot:2511011-Lingulodinium_polyedra.AAC.1